MDLVMAKPEVAHGSSLPVGNTAPVSPTRGHLTPLLRRIVFVGQPGLGKWLPETGNVFPFSCARWLRPTRSRFWRGDRRTCSSKSSREADRDTAEGEAGFSGGQGGPEQIWRCTALRSGRHNRTLTSNLPRNDMAFSRPSGLNVGSQLHSRRSAGTQRRSVHDPKP